jgi:hypothetical protein
MNSTIIEIEKLHRAYTETTGLQCNLRVHERAFADFLAHGFTTDDLICVLKYLMRENQRMAGAKFTLRLDRLMDYEYRHFDSLLSEARAGQRNRVKPAPKAETLKSWRGLPTQTEHGAPCRRVGDILRNL